MRIALRAIAQRFAFSADGRQGGRQHMIEQQHNFVDMDRRQIQSLSFSTTVI